MPRRKLPAHVLVPVWCYDEAAEPDGLRAFSTIKVPVANPYAVPAEVRPALLEELGYGDAEREAGYYEPSIMIHSRDVDAALAAAGYRV